MKNLTKLSKNILPLIVVLFLMSCAAEQKVKHERFKIVDTFINENNLKPLDNVFAFTFRGWSALDDWYLIVDSGLNRNYLLKLEGYCSQLSYATQIKLNQSTANRLQRHFDSVTVINSTVPQNCRIADIYLLNKEQKNSLNAVFKAKGL